MDAPQKATFVYKGERTRTVTDSQAIDDLYDECLRLLIRDPSIIYVEFDNGMLVTYDKINGFTHCNLAVS